MATLHETGLGEQTGKTGPSLQNFTEQHTRTGHVRTTIRQYSHHSATSTALPAVKHSHHSILRAALRTVPLSELAHRHDASEMAYGSHCSFWLRGNDCHTLLQGEACMQWYKQPRACNASSIVAGMTKSHEPRSTQAPHKGGQGSKRCIPCSNRTTLLWLLRPLPASPSSVPATCNLHHVTSSDRSL